MPSFALPITINSMQDLENIADNLAGDYQLGSDIDASGYAFASLGLFSGALNGNGHQILNLTAGGGSPMSAGLFMQLQPHAVVENLKLTNVAYNSSPFGVAGGLAASNYGTIRNVSVSGTITASSAGGVVGRNEVGGIIESSSAAVTVSGTNSAGGIAAENYGAISNSSSSGQVSGSGSCHVGCWLVALGGLSGNNVRATIAGSYSTATVTGSDAVAGGLVGVNAGFSSYASIVGSYATGNVTIGGEFAGVGGLVGANDPNSLIGNSFARGAVSGIAVGDSAHGGTAFSHVGGLVGSFQGGTIDQAYSTGHVFGSASGTGYSYANVGGSLGDGWNYDPSSSITSTYWDTQSSGTTLGVGDYQSGPIGLSTAQLTSGVLPAGFSTSAWSASSGYYPTLRGLNAGPTLPPQSAPQPKNFLSPLYNNVGQYHLVTEIGGESSSTTSPPYVDDFHKGGGYYSLDLASDASGTVRAAAAGVVVYVNASKANYGPVVVIYNGNGYFTEYREFTAPLVNTGDVVAAKQDIGSYILGQTGPLGSSALHFQVKYNAALTGVAATDYPSFLTAQAAFLKQNHDPAVTSAWDKDLKLSGENIAQLANITLDGVPLANYQLQNGKGIVRYSVPLPLGGTNKTVSLQNFQTFDATVTANDARLQERSPAYIWSDMTIPTDAEYLTFDYLWNNVGDGDYLSVYFDDRLLANILGSDFTGTDFITIPPISIADLTGKTGQLLFYLNSVGSANADLEVRNVSIVSDVPKIGAAVPESNTGILFAGALLGMGTLLRLRRSRSNAGG